MRNNIIKVVAAILIAVIVSSCETMEPSLEGMEAPIYPHYGLIEKPKKTITIKRKKPTITNPSPRPLSADNKAYYDEYEEFGI